MTESELFKRYRETGDRALRNEIAERYLYIAAVIAKKFVGRGVEYDDLYQVASLALVKGIDRFDETKGVKFSTFITPTITGEIKNYFRDHARLIHLPRRITELRYLVRRTAEEGAAAGKKLTAQEIAQRIGVTEEEVLDALEAGGVVSLDAPAGEGEDISYHAILGSVGDAFEKIENRDALLAALKELSEHEREMVHYRFGKSLSQAETARHMGVSQMYISRMERKVLEKLRETLKKSMA